MQTSLLTALNYLEWRKNKKKKHRPGCGQLSFAKALSYLRTVFELRIPGACDRGAILSEVPSSKTREAIDFVASHIEARMGFVERVRLIRSPGAILFVIMKFQWKRVRALYPLLSRKYSDHVLRSWLIFWVLALSYERCFRRRTPAGVVVLSDISINRLAMAFAARRCGVPVIYYQFSPKHNCKPPFRPDTAICMNEGLTQAVREAWPDTRIIKRDFFSKTPFRYPEYKSKNNAIGIALNKAIKPDKINELVTLLNDYFPEHRIILRPHPLTQKNLLSRVRCEISYSERDLSYFCNGIDFCITGNTSSTYKILFNGVPCIYVYGMDSGKYDLNKYVYNGIVFEFKNQFFCINEISNFYVSKKTKIAINEYIVKNII